jgi:uncharacterized protein YuzE
MERTILRADLILETCGQKGYTDHTKGCYIRFKEGKPIHTKRRDDCIVDYDETGKIIGIEFYNGLNDMEK